MNIYDQPVITQMLLYLLQHVKVFMPVTACYRDLSIDVKLPDIHDRLFQLTDPAAFNVKTGNAVQVMLIY